MRLDKFLQVSRLVKRRALAKEMCLRGQVTVNGGVAKAGRDVAIGDVISVNFGSRVIQVEVTVLPAETGLKGRDLYRILRDERTVDPRAWPTIGD